MVKKKPSIRAVRILIREGVVKHKALQQEAQQNKRRNLDQKRQELLDKVRAMGKRRAPTIIAGMRRSGMAFAKDYRLSWSMGEDTFKIYAHETYYSKDKTLYYSATQMIGYPLTKYEQSFVTKAQDLLKEKNGLRNRPFWAESTFREAMELVLARAQIQGKDLRNIDLLVQDVIGLLAC